MTTNDDSNTEICEMKDGLKRQKVVVPEGMSKNAWKRLQKQKKWDEQKDEFRLKRREKKRAARERKAEQKTLGIDTQNTNYHQEAKKELPASQEPSGVRVIMDCDFDELMSDKEIVSLSNQITRCYSAKRHSQFDVDLLVSGFNKRLEQRFAKSISDYSKWKGIEFQSNHTLSEILPKDEKDLSHYVYLTADTECEIHELKEGHTYIIGGIVDKNRHKELCLNKAKELGLQVGRLPIGKYIQMNGRHVLATSHVYEIICMWFEKNKDWEKAFNAVLPPRKLQKNSTQPIANNPSDSESSTPQVKNSDREPSETV